MGIIEAIKVNRESRFWCHVEDQMLIKLLQDDQPWIDISTIIGRPIGGCKSRRKFLIRLGLLSANAMTSKEENNENKRKNKKTISS